MLRGWGFRPIPIQPFERKPEKSGVKTGVRSSISLVKRSPSRGRCTGSTESLYLDLLSRIDPNLRFPFVHLDPAGDPDVFAYDPG
jgi:hypothetical protein